MKNYIPKSSKSKALRKLINESLEILESVGIPFEGLSELRLERMAECFLAVADVRKDWSTVKSSSDERYLRTRDIIPYLNKYFDENISSGSYDDVRRRDLKPLVLAELIVNSADDSDAATTDPTRGYALHPDFKDLILSYGTLDFPAKMEAFIANKGSLSESLNRKRNLKKIPVKLPNGVKIELSAGEHNLLQKKIIDEFLPNFGSDSEVLYIGDTSNKILYVEKEKLQSLNFFELLHDKLPDIIAFSRTNNWLYLIEAVHSSGTMNEMRVYELRKLLKDCTSELIFVTAFLTKSEFKKWMTDIAWETEVWIAEKPEHLIHFNGHKFLGPY